LIKINDDKKEMIKGYNIPVGAHIMVNKGQKIQAGDILVKIPRSTGRSGDITGGLPRVTELFEARNLRTRLWFLKLTESFLTVV